MSANRNNTKHILKVIDNTREAAEHFLMSLAENDNDFNGNNGPDYLWDFAEGYKCNADYALAEAKKKDTIEDMICEFVDIWMKYDCYYSDYDVEFLETGDKIVVSFIYTEAV